MANIFFILTMLAALVGFSCDPVRRIDMKNETGDSATIIWTLREDEDSLGFNPFLISNSQELTFNLHPPKSNEIKMSFGAGSWTPTEVEKLVRQLKSLQIVTRSQRIKIDSLPLLRDFLLARRQGVGGARITIVLPKAQD